MNKKHLLLIALLAPVFGGYLSARSTALIEAVISQKPLENIAALLEKKEIDVNAAGDHNKWTALHWAAKVRNAAIVKKLLDGGATVATGEKETPLDIAKKRLAAAEAKIANPEINEKTKEKWTQDKAEAEKILKHFLSSK